MTIPKKFIIPFFVLVIVAPVVISIVVQYGGLYLNNESSSFLLNYWDRSRSLFSLVFDPLTNDWGLYQARELSYFFDYLDASFILSCIKSGIPHYFSLITILFYISAAIAFMYFGLKEFKNTDDYSILIISLMMLIMPGTFWGLCFFRSSKPACMLSLTVLSFGLYWFFNNFRKDGNDAQKKKALLLIFVFEVFMLMMDRQGVIFTVIISIGSCLALIILSWRRQTDGFGWMVKLLIFTLIALSWGTFYNLYLGPKIIFAGNGYYPSSAFQSMGLESLFNFRGGLTFIMYNMGGMLGGLGTVAGYLFAILIGIGILSPLIKGNSNPAIVDKSIYCFTAYAYVMICFIGSVNIMTFRHQPLLWPDVIRGGYFNPFMVVILFFFAISINSFLSTYDFRGNKYIVITILSFLLLANVMYLPKAREVIMNGHVKPECNQAQNLLQVLRDPSIDYRMVNLSVDEFNIASFVRGKPLLELK